MTNARKSKEKGHALALQLIHVFLLNSESHQGWKREVLFVFMYTLKSHFKIILITFAQISLYNCFEFALY